METWDLLDKDGMKIGKTIEKSTRLPNGLYHLGVDVWIKNDGGQYLIQRRSETKAIARKMDGDWWFSPFR